MYFVYAIYSNASNKIYIGYTSNLSARIDAHNHPKNNGWTKNFQPWRLVFAEEFIAKREAMKREKELKSHLGRRFLRSKISK